VTRVIAAMRCYREWLQNSPLVEDTDPNMAGKARVKVASLHTVETLGNGGITPPFLTS
jgi:hypothetical protein